MSEEALPHPDRLSSAEKLLLLEELSDDVAGKPAEVPIHQWQRDELENRYQEYLNDPSEGSSWSEVRDRLMRAFR